MASRTRKYRKPTIRVARTDYERLLVLAESVSARNGDVTDELQAELDRARVVADGRIAANVIRMGSTAHFTSDLGNARRVTLVFPGDADIEEGKVSILTPIGVALLGLSEGQSIDWTTRDGTVHRLTVQSVETPSPVFAPSAQMKQAI
jgi:regulator of nucleoside diphosphate kinase